MKNQSWALVECFVLSVTTYSGAASAKERSSKEGSECLSFYCVHLEAFRLQGRDYGKNMDRIASFF